MLQPTKNMKSTGFFFLCHRHTKLIGTGAKCQNLHEKYQRQFCGLNQGSWNHESILFPVCFSVSMFLQLITRAPVPFSWNSLTIFLPWSHCKVEMLNLWQCNHFHGYRLSFIKTRLWWLHCRIKQKEKPGSKQKKLYILGRNLFSIKKRKHRKLLLT